METLFISPKLKALAERTGHIIRQAKVNGVLWYALYGIPEGADIAFFRNSDDIEYYLKKLAVDYDILKATKLG